MSALLEVCQLAFIKPREPGNNESSGSAGYLLEDVSFIVPEGGIFAIVGPSGSGKSTLLKCLCRLEEASEGEILFHQHPIRDLDPRRLRQQMTMVFQIPVLMGPKVWDDLETGKRWKNGKKMKLARDRSWARALLERVHLEERFLEENPKNLSVGEAQRVALARALAIEPEVLLLDEPTASLDVDSKSQIEKSILELTQNGKAQNGMTVLLVSHDPSQIEKLARHGVELQNGKLSSSW